MSTTQETNIQIAYCGRCGMPCKVAAMSNEKARLLQHSTVPSGYCPDCAVADFMQNQSHLAELMQMNPLGKQMLLDSRMQAQFAGLLQAGNADAKPTEINWQRVHDNWDLPFPKVHKSNKRTKKGA